MAMGRGQNTQASTGVGAARSGKTILFVIEEGQSSEEIQDLKAWHQTEKREAAAQIIEDLLIQGESKQDETRYLLRDGQALTAQLGRITL
jgi:hypothetical protein